MVAVTAKLREMGCRLEERPGWIHLRAPKRPVSYTHLDVYKRQSQDHLDYFHTMENYFETKLKFFHSGMVRNATFNADEETTARMLEGLEIPAMTYGICANADLYARDIEITENGVSFNMQLAGMHNIPVNLRLTGMFNVYNAIAAASMAMICLLYTSRCV